MDYPYMDIVIEKSEAKRKKEIQRRRRKMSEFERMIADSALQNHRRTIDIQNKSKLLLAEGMEQSAVIAEKLYGVTCFKVQH